MNDVFSSYRAKLRTADEAVKAVKSGDWVGYTSNVGFPVLLDRALARRRDELWDVKLRGNLMFGPLVTPSGSISAITAGISPPMSASSATGGFAALSPWCSAITPGTIIIFSP